MKREERDNARFRPAFGNTGFELTWIYGLHLLN